MTAANRSNLSNLNIVPECIVKTTVWDSQTETMKFKTLAKTLYTPKYITMVINAHKEQSVWVFFAGGKELWAIPKGQALAKQA